MALTFNGDRCKPFFCCSYCNY